MDSVYDTRLRNLRQLMRERGGPTSLAKALGHSNASYLAQIAGPNPRRSIGEKAARDIEAKLHLPAGSLDLTTQPRRNPIEIELLAQCVHAVTAAATDTRRKPTPAQFAELVALVYEGARSSGQLDEDFIHRLLRLTK